MVDHSAKNYFDVGVKIVAWGIGEGKPVFRNANNTIEDITTLPNYRDVSERLMYQAFEDLKKTPKEDRMFKRQGLGKGDLVIHKNYHRGTLGTCKEYVMSKRQKLVISTSKGLLEQNLIFSEEQFGNLYVQLDISEYSKTQIENVTGFLLHKQFYDYCNTFRLTYGTGFNNVLIYMPKIDINKPPEENLLNFEIC